MPQSLDHEEEEASLAGKCSKQLRDGDKTGACPWEMTGGKSDFQPETHEPTSPFWAQKFECYLDTSSIAASPRTLSAVQRDSPYKPIKKIKNKLTDQT